MSDTTSAEGRSIDCRLRRGQYLGEISALCFLHLPSQLSPFPLLLAGTGSQILVYELSSGKLIRPFQVFDGIRVHGISLERLHDKQQLAGPTIAFRVAVFGERRVKLFGLEIGQAVPPLLNLKLTLIQSLPKFGHWVLDVRFLKDGVATDEDDYLAVGCSDNAVHFWDIFKNNMFSQVKSSERCLLYSMRMLGNDIGSLCIASGTIFNEILVWKVVCRNHATVHGSHVEDYVQQIVDDGSLHHLSPRYKDVTISRLVGHEGSIFRIAWFPSGLKLVSVSDDRSARIWKVQPEKGDPNRDLHDEIDHVTSPVLFGHNARIWDCCVFGSGIITAGEDCTCRVWDHNGTELNEIKEHIGRGVWRCLYDPTSSLVVTAGFDSAIKVHHLFPSSKGVEGIVASKNVDEREEVFTLSIPNSSGNVLLDSKSEYVRCLQFSGRDSLYVATNNGYLYYASFFKSGTVKWTKLVCIGEGAPIICMDLLSECSSSPRGNKFEDCIIAIGDGKGNITIVRVVGTDGSNPVVESTLTWSAEKERHLLGVHWCKSSNNRRFVFTADPGGRLKLWLLCHDLTSASLFGKGSCNALLIAEYISCFERRIMCVDASFTKELLVCGDIRGNLLLFSLPRGILPCGTTCVVKEVEASSPVNYFKGAHGVSSVCSVSIVGLCSDDQVEIQSTGADGCICYLQHDKNMVKLEFIGMKQVKELSAVRSIFLTANDSDGNYAVGFASENFIIWNLTSETKVTQIKCGGWRRPHAYYLGDFPEMMNCFSFVKNDVIYVHRHWVPKNEIQVYPRNLHLQFHGREIHSLCFIGGGYSDENGVLVSGSSWIATGCEDGTVRLTRYEQGTENWSSSKYLGEHVGGSAVRSICYVSKIHKLEQPDSIEDMPNNGAYYGQNGILEDRENSYVLISVGSKRVVTAWKQIITMSNKSSVDAPCRESTNSMDENFYVASSLETLSSLSFQWLSTDMPSKHTTSCANSKNTKQVFERATLDHPGSIASSDAISVGLPSSNCRKMGPNLCLEEDNRENDWRYLDVTAFLVKDADSRSMVCFVVVACSDATVTLRALVLPFRLWFDIASLGPLSSPVLALQHVVVPMLSSRGNIFLAISGSTDGSIGFWDLTECVEKFMRRISGLEMENDMEFQKRPHTGRGSQGGRWWQSIDSHFTSKKKKKQGDDGGGSSFGVAGVLKGGKCNSDLLASGNGMGNNNHASHSESKNGGHVSEVQECDHASSHKDSRRKRDEETNTEVVAALHVLRNVHQSGVNNIHVSSDIMLSDDSSRFSFHVVSGGDDQAINCHRCDLEIVNTMKDKSTHELTQEKINFTILPPSTASNYNHRCLILNHQMQFVHLDKISSAHSSAVKGVWTDGIWVFSVGLDQRVRCWKLMSHDRLTEYTHLIISVPEPEALDVKACGRNRYQIIVAGRGMQMVEFFAASRTGCGD